MSDAIAAATAVRPAATAPDPGANGASRTASEPGLDLHEGIATPGCQRAPKALALVDERTGEMVVPRCRAPRKCAYCGRLAAVENAEMVALDATRDAPGVFVVLTTRDPDVDGATVRADLRKAWLAVRRRFPGAEYACFVEFTTGLSVWSGGRRRIHLNLLVKGVDVDAADELRRVLLDTWGRRTNTHQLHVGAVYAAEGLVRYVTNLALHVMKDGQKPPSTYAGHLVRWSRGYFAEGATLVRDEARRSLRVKRLIHRGVDAETAALEVELSRSAWVLHQRELGERRPVVHGGRVVEFRTERWRPVERRAEPLTWLDDLIASRRGRADRPARDGDRAAAMSTSLASLNVLGYTPTYTLRGMPGGP